MPKNCTENGKEQYQVLRKETRFLPQIVHLGN